MGDLELHAGGRIMEQRKEAGAQAKRTDVTAASEVDRLFDEACGLSAEAQASFLDRACAGRPELRQQVKKLLAADRASERFLASPAARLQLSDRSRGAELPSSEAPPAPSTKAGTPDRLGSYRLLRPLAEGGMGRVFLAASVSADLDRLVAVKVMAPGQGLALRGAPRDFRAERTFVAAR